MVQLGTRHLASKRIRSSGSLTELNSGPADQSHLSAVVSSNRQDVIGGTAATPYEGSSGKENQSKKGGNLGSVVRGNTAR